MKLIDIWESAVDREERWKKARDPIAKNLNKFNKPKTHKDKKNDFKRKEKFEKKEGE